MNFYKYTGINTIWFSELGRFTELLGIVEQYEELTVEKEYQKAFLSNLYRPFRQIYLDRKSVV